MPVATNHSSRVPLAANRTTSTTTLISEATKLGTFRTCVDILLLTQDLTHNLRSAAGMLSSP